MFIMVDYVKEMAVNKFCKYGGDGSLEHRLMGSANKTKLNKCDFNFVKLNS